MAIGKTRNPASATVNILWYPSYYADVVTCIPCWSYINSRFSETILYWIKTDTFLQPLIRRQSLTSGAQVLRTQV